MDFKTIFLSDLDWPFAAEIALRTLIMFALIIIFLRLTGKKGIRQLSLFEVAIIIGLGSAAGDPMFTEENAILPAFIVFLTIILFYRLITWLAAKNERFESILEGDPLYIIEDGMFCLIDTQTFAKDEFFSEMRQQNIEHLGQVRTAILETNGNVSFFYYTDDQVKPGLPILPKAYQNKVTQIVQPGEYACTTCGHVEEITSGTYSCQRCQKQEWVEAIQTVRQA